MARSVETLEDEGAGVHCAPILRVLRWGQRGSRPKALVQVAGGVSGGLLPGLGAAFDALDDACALVGEVVVLELAGDGPHDLAGSMGSAVLNDVLSALDTPTGPMPGVLEKAAFERCAKASLARRLAPGLQALGRGSAVAGVQLLLGVDADLIVDLTGLPQGRSPGDRLVGGARSDRPDSTTGLMAAVQRFWHEASLRTGRQLLAPEGGCLDLSALGADGQNEAIVAKISELLFACGVASPECSV